MTYRIRLSDMAAEQLEYWSQCGNTSAFRKIGKIIAELQEHPMEGTGKPERLRGNLQGWWSRRITKSDRIVYCINGDEVLVDVVSMRGHYDNI